jgi:EmrB/QacA subfamily drug resistance transporter
VETGGTAPRVDRRPLWVFLGLMLASLMGTLDTSIVATALPTMVGALGGLDHIAWVGTAYLLTMSVSMPVLGKLGDQLNRKTVFLFSVIAFVVGSAACGAAQSMGQLIAFRALQGIGGGGLLVSGFAMVADLFGPRERARYQGYAAGVWAISSVAGPLVGGLLTDHLGWRWVFFINLPLGLVAMAMVATFFRAPATRERPRIDYAGAILLGGAVTCLVLLVGWALNQYPTGSPIVLGLAAAGAVLLAGWFMAARRAAEPVIPLSLFRDSTFTISNVLAFVAGFVMLAFVTFLPLFLQIVNGSGITQSGLLLLPMMAGLVVGAGLSGIAISKSGHYKWYPVASLALIGLAAYLLSTMTPDTPRLLSSFYMTMLGIGAGLSQQVLVVAVQNTAPAKDMGAATATVTFIRMVGSSFGIAVFGAVLRARLAEELPRYVPAGALGSGFEHQTLSPQTVRQLSEPVREGLAQAFSHALTTVFLTALPVVVLGLIVALFLKDVPLRESAFGHGPPRKDTSDRA